MFQQCWTGGYTTQHAQVFVARMPSVQLAIKPQVSPAVVPRDVKATLIFPMDVKVHNLLTSANLFDFMYMEILNKMLYLFYY